MAGKGLNKDEPTLGDVLKEVQGFGNRLAVLENWKISEDAYRAALAQVKNEERQAKNDNNSAEVNKRRLEILKQVGIVLALIAAILYAYAATKGITVK